MPPKKKKPTPVVVGTVSTRSTRRESIVNIKIVPKTNKPVAKTPAQKKTLNTSSKTPSNKDIEQGQDVNSEKTSPEILELLKDWSDDESSQDNSFLPISASSKKININKNKHVSTSVSDDQQSLIDILEGNHLESRSVKNVLEYEHKEPTQSLPNPNKFSSAKELIIENLIVNVDSPQIEESEIIEECVVEDDSIIIEMPVEQMELTPRHCDNEDKRKKLRVCGEDISSTDNKLKNTFVKAQVQESSITFDSDNSKQGSSSPIYITKTSKDTCVSKKYNLLGEEIVKKKDDLSGIPQHTVDIGESVFSSSHGINDENRSITSEDTTSQSMITVQDDDAYDINDIQISDNSTNNYEVIEEQVVFDTSESIIMENLQNVESSDQQQKDNLLENVECHFGVQIARNIETQPKSKKIILSGKQLENLKKLSDNNSSPEIFKNIHENMTQKASTDISESHENISKVERRFNIVSKDNLSKILDKASKGPKKDLVSASTTLPKFMSVQKSSATSDNISIEKVHKENTSSSESTLSKYNENLQNLSGKIKEPDKTISISNLKGNERRQSIIATSPENKLTKSKRQGHNLKITEIQLETERKHLDAQADENSLCQKINELMDITRESPNLKVFDPASDKLQEGIKKMHIQEKSEEIKPAATARGSMETKNKESKYLENTGKQVESKKVQSMSIKEKQDEEIFTLKSNLICAQSLVEKSSMDFDKTPKSSHNKNDIFGIDIKQRRRSTRRKPVGNETEHSETEQLEEPAKLQDVSDKEPLNPSLISTLEKHLLDKRSSQFFDVGEKINEKNDYAEMQGTDGNSKIFDMELDSNKDSKSSKDLKEKHKKTLGALASPVTKMDIDSESSEAKTSEAEGDSTSNESSQSSNSASMFKTRAKKVFIQQVDELDEMDLKLNLDTKLNKSNLGLDMSIDDNSQNKEPKETKTSFKKTSKRNTDEEIGKMDFDLNKSKIASSNTKFQADIDATIDEVLRKYTQEDPGTPEECASPKELKAKVAKPVKESKKKKETKSKKDEKYEASEEVRRSDRIKTILPIKKKSHGLVRSKSESALSGEAESSDSNSVHSELDKATPVSPQLNKKYKAKSKAKSSENLQVINSGSLLPESSPQLPKVVDLKADKSGKAEIEARLKTFFHLKENQYKTDRQISKEAREMICDCYLAEEDIKKDEYGCGEDCLNRLLMIECGYLCQIGDRCTNKRFQKGQFAPVEVFKTEKKGLGLIAAANIPYGEFILEYVGEVLNPEEFDKRAEVYSKDKNIHFYFMSLRSDAIIDATMKGNISRFINHSCDPNAETQKWTVNGELRIGFFSTRTILAGEEVTFDYKFQRYGKEAQKCYCGAASCRGWLGERPDESEDEDEEEEEELSKAEQGETTKPEIKVLTPHIFEGQVISQKSLSLEKSDEKMEIDTNAEVAAEVKMSQEASVTSQAEETAKKITKKKPRKELLFEDFDQLNEDIDMVVTTGLKNQAHTLKLSRLMVRAKDLDQRKKLLRVLRRGELPCRRLFLDYHGLRLMHGYMIDAQQLTNGDKKANYSQLEFFQTKLELLQTLAVLPIQNKTMLIESKVLPAVDKWAKNEDLVEDSIDQRDGKNSPKDINKHEDSHDPAVNEKIDEIKFLASKLLEEWANLKESFRIPKKQRIEQMKEHEKEANRKFVESSYAQEKESSRKNDQRYRSWSRYKSERESNKKGHREDKDKPSAEYLKMSKQERRKLFALQMELKEEERRLKQREMWRQHEMNCMMIGADPRFTAPFDPSKGFQYIWNPSIGQWQALPVPSGQDQGATSFNVPPNQGISGYSVPPTHHKPNLLGHYAPSMLNVAGMTGPAQQYPAPQKNNFNSGATSELTRGMQPNIASMVPGLSTSVSTITSTVAGIAGSLPAITGLVPGMAGTLHGISGSTPGIPGSVPGITQPPLPALPMYSEVKQLEEDPSQVKFAGPIPSPAKLPPKWKCAKDKYGRPYYYHVKLRKSQWEPPPLSEEAEESSDTSSSETSSLSSSGSSSESDTDDEIDDTKLLMEVRKQMETTTKFSLKSVIPQHVKKEEKDSCTPSPEVKIESDDEDEPVEEVVKEDTEEDPSEPLTSIDIRLKEQFNLDSNDPPKKKRRIGLCQEIIISPRTEADRQQFKEDLKRYKATKEKLKRQKDHMLYQAKKKLKTSSSDDTRRSKDKRLLKSTAKSRIKQMEWNDEHAKKIKEVFRSTMATTVVGVLNAYRKPECMESRITNTEDFKHLARKLTHFVMLKEMKHINTIEELICTDNVKAKAREYIRKYMSKFGEVYQKRQDEPDFKD